MAGSGRITLSDIARRADTSPMAVSVVLNGARSNTRVADTTRRRILDAAAELKYTPNALARGLKRQRTNTLGVLFNWAGSRTIHDLYSVAVLDGVVDGAATAGYHILLYTQRWHSAAASSATFADRRADGVIVVAPQEQSDVVPGLVALGLPVALVSSATDVAQVPYVSIDNRKAVALAMEHLRGLGHARIAYAGYGRDRYSMRERHDAYRSWMAQHELPVPDAYVLADLLPGQSDSNVGILRDLLCLPQRPTAIFAANDDLAAEVLEAARSAAIAVPEQLSVIGFDDVLVASLTVPKLTTIRQPLYEMGQQAARLLIESIEGRRDASVSSAHTIEPELIARASTAAAPSALS
jgi:LacI family transcriptional regulator